MDAGHHGRGCSIMELVVGIGILILIAINLAINIARGRRKSQPQVTLPPPPQVNVNLKPLQDAMERIPNKVLQSITSSSNTQKGALGELIGYLQLRASYDRIIPLGNIVDFICISFPDSSDAGHVDFIDIKTGNRCRLSKDQRALQKLIEDKRINFIKLKVETTHNEDPS